MTNIDLAGDRQQFALNLDAHACEVHGVRQRRACQAFVIDRSTVRYTSIRPDDARLREAMKSVAAERRRFGYRRIHVRAS